MKAPIHSGQCRFCRFVDVLVSPRSAFIRCGRSQTDPRFPRYPALPMRDCSGFEASGDEEKEPPEPALDES